MGSVGEDGVEEQAAGTGAPPAVPAPATAAPRARAAVPAVLASGLTKRYGETTALDDLDLEVAPGEVLGYLGPNGAGKTTTIRLLLGLVRPSAGRAALFGVDCEREPVQAHRRVASVPGEAALWPNLTGAETLHLLGRVHGRVDEAYRDELVERFDLDPTKKVRAYSRGNRQKVLLIGALMTRADLLVLDEPTSGLDPLMEQTFRHEIHTARDRGQTVFLSSHVLSEVEALCDRVAILRRGRLVEIGSLSEMRHLSAVTVEATFAGAPPDVGRLSCVPGVTGAVHDGRSLRCRVQGPIGPFLDVINGAGVEHLIVREPSLEELFLAQYGDGEGGGGGAAGGDGSDGAAAGMAGTHGGTDASGAAGVVR